jgi:hypothetical protein
MTRSTVKQMLAAACAILAVQCGGSGTGPTTGQSTASIQIASTPQTIVYAVCPQSHCGPLAGQLEIEATLTLRESAGVAATVNHLVLTIRRRSDNAAIAANDVVGASAPIRVAARGSTPVPIAMHFDATAAEPNMKIVVALDATDANGYQITASTEVEIRAP